MSNLNNGSGNFATNNSSDDPRSLGTKPVKRDVFSEGSGGVKGSSQKPPKK